jgi:hypothetical protein
VDSTAELAIIAKQMSTPGFQVLVHAAKVTGYSQLVCGTICLLFSAACCVGFYLAWTEERAGRVEKAEVSDVAAYAGMLVILAVITVLVASFLIFLGIPNVCSPDYQVINDLRAIDATAK